MTIAVADVCTHAQLNDFLGGQVSGQIRLMAADATDSTIAREDALDRVLTHLKRRTPPIRDNDLDDVTELTRAVKYGAAEYLYRTAITRGGDAEVFALQRKIYNELFDDELESLMPTVNGGLRGPSTSIGISRR